MNIETALARMGYRELSPKKWLKPIGFGVVIADLTVGQIRSHYMGTKGKPYCWKTQAIPKDEETGSFLRFIANFEEYDVMDGASVYFDFSFLTIDQQVEKFFAE